MRQLRPDRPQEKNAHDPKFNTASLRPRGFCCAVRRDLFPPVTASWRFWVLDVNPPAFQFYPDDFIGGTVDLSTEDVGAYIRLLCYQWGRGSIPDAPLSLQRIAGCQVSKDVLSKFPGGKNRRLELVRSEQIEYRKTRAKVGKLGADARWLRHGSGMAQAMREPSSRQCPSIVEAMPKHAPLPPPPSPTPVQGSDKASDKAKKLSKRQRELAVKMENLLAAGWVNDAGKWITRIRQNFRKTESVCADLEVAVREGGVDWPAAYAEDTWKRFKKYD